MQTFGRKALKCQQAAAATPASSSSYIVPLSLGLDPVPLVPWPSSKATHLIGSRDGGSTMGLTAAWQGLVKTNLCWHGGAQWIKVPKEFIQIFNHLLKSLRKFRDIRWSFSIFQCYNKFANIKMELLFQGRQS